jgi:SAM-dependent methyltransferase
VIEQTDALTSPTLKHLRAQWWTDAFTAFLAESLRPKPGMRILDVGCGSGTAEVNLARLRLSQLDMVGIDRSVARVSDALTATRYMNATVGFAAADACHLPFPDASFDATFCVAVLQHIGEVSRALAECARVTKPGGKFLAVEPDNGARYWFSSLPSGMAAFDKAQKFFAASTSAGREAAPAAVGALIPGLLPAAGIQPLSVRLFPVFGSSLGASSPKVWDARRKAAQAGIDGAADDNVRRLGKEFLAAIEEYARDANAAGTGFVEIQNTLLVATVGQRED